MARLVAANEGGVEEGAEGSEATASGPDAAGALEVVGRVDEGARQALAGEEKPASQGVGQDLGQALQRAVGYRGEPFYLAQAAVRLLQGPLAYVRCALVQCRDEQHQLLQLLLLHRWRRHGSQIGRLLLRL